MVWTFGVGSVMMCASSVSSVKYEVQVLVSQTRACTLVLESVQEPNFGTSLSR